MIANINVRITEEGKFQIESDTTLGLTIMMLSDAIGQVSREIYASEETEDEEIEEALEEQESPVQ